MKFQFSTLIIFLFLWACLSCSPTRKIDRIRRGEVQASLNLGQDTSYLPIIRNRKVTRDTLKIKDDAGQEILIMKAVRMEETGEMVASDVLDAAVVTARFRNIAERHGKIDLAFQVVVPASMQDSKWQLRFYPDMYILDDSLRLEPVVITGSAYRKAQLKGYEQYERFLSKIVSDTLRFVDINQLEIFLRRNIPQIYAFKTDSSEVSDEQFESIYGVTEREAVEHYTNKFARYRNNRRKARQDEMYRKYVKAPIVTEGIRLDTVMVGSDGTFIYNYIQTINTRPRLRKVDTVLSGEIYEIGKKIYDIPRSEPLTFYISSLSTLADNKERYIFQVLERHAAANTMSYVEFKTGKSDVDPEFGNNRKELGRVRRNIAGLLDNQTFDLDSIVVTASASPEGKVSLNNNLSQRRSEAISHYLNGFIRSYEDSVTRERGLFYDENGRRVDPRHPKISFISRSIGENWDLLDRLVDADSLLTEGEKSLYALHAALADPDQREQAMQADRIYPYLRQVLYPRLRAVRFDFYLHRKDMVKDTVHTTVLDSTYMWGLQALKNMDYHTAVKALGSYKDYNTAVALVALDRNLSALEILQQQQPTPEVNYLLALVYSRLGDETKAVEHYVRSCQQNHSFVYRGNLDPEISLLIKTYGLNQEDDTHDEM